MKILISAALAYFCARPLLALDFGADYLPTTAQANMGKGFFAGFAAQETYFNDTQLNGHAPPINPGLGTLAPLHSQYLRTITSEPFLGYNFNDRFGVQLDLPVIYRESTTVRAGNEVAAFYYDHRSEYGMGDIRLAGHVGLLKKNTTDYTINWNVSGGVKFPTGDSGNLRFVDFTSGFSGHDFALGSGSYDGLVGTDFQLRQQRFLLTAEMQYDIRTEGDFGYQFANDLSWSCGPGYYLLMNNDCLLSLQALVSGDTKGDDTVKGFPLRNTAETGVYLGPQIDFTWRNKLSAQLGADLPVSIVTDGIQIVPTFRIRAAVTWRF